MALRRSELRPRQNGIAQRVSSINSISALCERTGASVTEVAQTLRLRQTLPSPLRALRLPHAYIGHNGEVSSPSHKSGVGEYEVEAGAPLRSSGEVRLGVQWRW